MKTTTTIMKRFKLATVQFEVDDFLASHPDILYRASGPTAYDAATGEFSFSGSVDFCTYFNAVSVSKWRTYTDVLTVRLHLEVAGDPCTVQAVGLTLSENDAVVKQRGERAEKEASDDFARVEIDVPFNNMDVSGFLLTSKGTTRVRNAYYYTLAEIDHINPVNIALCTTTFKKEEFIVPNIARIERDVLGSGEPISSHFHMYVVDNGRTLDVEALTSPGVTICPNDNVGGSGGFARGMLEALNADEDFTHVILMDDDVRVSPESFKRVYALLSLANSKYARAFINGAMLQLERPNVQFEDVAFVRDSGGYEKIKPDLEIDQLHDVVYNERISVEREKAYGAWWFSCIPMSSIKENGLPLPLFVRCDDVEYGVRCLPVYMTMNGICVWHSRFEGRFRAAVDCYQYVRNMLIVIAVDNCSSEKAFMLRFWRVFSIYLRTLNYSAAELWLDGFEDYLKGPEFLMNVNGSELMKKNSAKNEKLVPVDQLDPVVMQDLKWDPSWLKGQDTRPALLKVFETLPHDGHLLPDFMLRSKPAVVMQNGSITPWTESCLRKTLVVLNEDATEGAIRTFDRDRHKRLMARYRSLRFEYRNKGNVVAEQYRDNFRTMTSKAFWEKYLGLTPHGRA